MKMKVQIKQATIELKLRKYPYVELFGEEITDSLVQYDPESNTVTVDDRADDTYALLASVHECICCGPYKDLAPATEDPLDRCGAIDLMLMDQMSKEDRDNYRQKRIEMFSTLIDKRLNPSLDETFRHSLELLRNS